MKHHPREENCDGSIDVSTKKWGSLATGVRDSEECILGCRQRFVSGVLAESGKPSTASVAVETTDELCEVLASSADHSGAERISAFYRLYCCDSVVCGVWYNESAGIFGQDREDLPASLVGFLIVPCI